MGQVVGKFKGQFGEAMRLGTLARQRGAEASCSVIFVDGRSPDHENHTCAKKAQSVDR